jgi:TolB-like protein/DNA-binding winged helix-turn-helix (wHTH) protein/cytochrome c-type biogenesis protein CcmH/NrfG
MTSSTEAVRAQFADFELDLSSGELTRNGRLFRLQGQPFLVLRILLDRAGEVVTREELQRQLWPGETFVDFDHGLNKAIAKLRDALDDPKAESRLIQTLPRRGYRFNADVNWIGLRDGMPVPEEAVVPIHRVPSQYWLVSSIITVLVLTTAFWLSRGVISGWFGWRPIIQSIAVLPFVNLSNNPEQEYFADGMTEELITDLSYAKSMRVVSRASTIGFKNSNLSVPQIAEQLHVDAVIEGTVLRVDNKVRITIRLTAAKPERQLWAASYERDFSDVLALQNQIAAEAVAQIRTQLTPEERTRLSLESQINPAAYDEYLRARFILHQEDDQASNKAIPHLERAIQLDPNFAAAYAALGEAWALPWGKKSNRETSVKGLEYSQKAVSLDSTSSEAFASLGHSLMQSHRWNEGEVALRRAIELDPNNPYAAEYLAVLLVQKGRVNESLQVSRRLADANPVSADFQRVYANMLYRAHQYDEAIAQCQRIIDLDPSHLTTYGTLANALVESGRYPEAEAAFKKGNLLGPGVRAWLYAREGNPEGARQILNDHPGFVDAHTAVAKYLLGDQAAGLSELRRLTDEWNTKTYHLRNDPLFDPMRNDQRFTEIVKRSGLLDT